MSKLTRKANFKTLNTYNTKLKITIPTRIYYVHWPTYSFQLCVIESKYRKRTFEKYTLQFFFVFTLLDFMHSDYVSLPLYISYAALSAWIQMHRCMIYILLQACICCLSLNAESVCTYNKRGVDIDLNPQ